MSNVIIIQDTDETKISKGTSLIPLIDDPSTPEWKSAVFWQVNKPCFFEEILAGEEIIPNLLVTFNNNVKNIALSILAET